MIRDRDLIGSRGDDRERHGGPIDRFSGEQLGGMRGKHGGQLVHRIRPRWQWRRGSFCNPGPEFRWH